MSCVETGKDTDMGVSLGSCYVPIVIGLIWDFSEEPLCHIEIMRALVNVSCLC